MRSLRIVAALLLAICASLALAQDARTSEAQAAARDWIALVDKKAYQDSWRTAGTKFQANITAERWAQAVQVCSWRCAWAGSVRRRKSARDDLQRSISGAWRRECPGARGRSDRGSRPTVGSTRPGRDRRISP